MSVEISGFLTPDELIAQLPTQGLGLVDRPELLVRRLLALQLVDSVRMGSPDGPQMVSKAALQSYLQRGAPQLAPPELSGDWFSGRRVDWLSGQMCALIIQATAAGLPTISKTDVDGSTVRIAINGGMRKILNRPLDPPIEGSGTKVLPFKCAGEVYLVGRWQGFVAEAIAIEQAEKGIYGGGKLNYLYSDSASFERLISAGWKRLTSGSPGISFSSSIQVLDDAADSWNYQMQQVRRARTIKVFYMIPDSAILAATNTSGQRLRQLGF